MEIIVSSIIKEFVMIIEETFFLEENTIDHEKLLQTIHEDKTTISRAITQNKQLKEQLTELQDRFIKMVFIFYLNNKNINHFCFVISRMII